MLTWEYAVESWSFLGADKDPWPGRDAWNALPDVPHYDTEGRVSGVLSARPESPEARRIRRDYYVWRDQQEQLWLDEMGAAQFELVAVYRDEKMFGGFQKFPIIAVHCYFKRPRLPEEPPLPEKPRIGFQPPSPQ